MQCLTVIKSLGRRWFADMVQKGLVDMLFDGKKGQLVNNSKIDNSKLLILAIIEFYKIQVMSKSEATAAFQKFVFVLSFL